MQVQRAHVVHLLRSRGDDEGAARAQDELPEQLDADEAPQLLLTYGVDLQDLDDQETVEQQGTGPAGDESSSGLGSGAVSGLGISNSQEPEQDLSDLGTGQER